MRWAESAWRGAGHWADARVLPTGCDDQGEHGILELVVGSADARWHHLSDTKRDFPVLPSALPQARWPRFQSESPRGQLNIQQRLRSPTQTGERLASLLPSPVFNGMTNERVLGDKSKEKPKFTRGRTSRTRAAATLLWFMTSECRCSTSVDCFVVNETRIKSAQRSENEGSASRAPPDRGNA
ncbi:hypothetical protein PHLGIDRAFT_15944 [Phlebiopsis gigantea 11061_1 CR5-6]|uniref:Uncharacterized protein n=1 Tax=Phlebiopsis gigantea (strain 11061_1 CR5-6) TaxID=745531 RepID=A0A0C3PDH3_PHLG1|nr:hypothetical protein PHLGIDRAFT_15944 [Phlebiopsis gigantea 11061_1 CR5-6]